MNVKTAGKKKKTTRNLNNRKKIKCIFKAQISCSHNNLNVRKYEFIVLSINIQYITQTNAQKTLQLACVFLTTVKPDYF